MGEHLKHLFFILKCVVYVYVCFSDLLHPACVDVVQVGSLLWCLHLHKNTHTNTLKPVRTRTASHEPQWFKIFINNHHKSHDRCAESYIWLDYFSCNQKKLRWGVERVKIISCSSGMLPLSRKWIHAAARLHKHQRDSKTGWWMMLTILLIIKERGLCGSITERHTTLFRQFVSFVIFLKLCQQLLSYIFLAPEPETWNLWLTKAQVSP